MNAEHAEFLSILRWARPLGNPYFYSYGMVWGGELHVLATAFARMLCGGELERIPMGRARHWRTEHDES